MTIRSLASAFFVIPALVLACSASRPAPTPVAPPSLADAAPAPSHTEHVPPDREATPSDADASAAATVDAGATGAIADTGADAGFDPTVAATADGGARTGHGHGHAQPSTTPRSEVPGSGNPRAPGGADGDVARGRAAFQRRCHSCHPNAEADHGPRLRDRGFTEAQMRAQIRNGSRRMRAIPPSRLSNTDLDHLLGYLRAIGAVR